MDFHGEYLDDSGFITGQQTLHEDNRADDARDENGGAALVRESKQVRSGQQQQPDGIIQHAVNRSGDRFHDIVRYMT